MQKTNQIIDNNIPFYSYPSTLHCGSGKSFFINDNKQLLSIGYSKYYNLGHDIKTDNILKKPKIINSLNNIKMVDCGFSHTICINFNGDIFSFGSNENFLELGVERIEKYTFIPQQINLPPIDYISCGQSFTVCKTFDDKLYSFGCNYHGQLGLGTKCVYKTPQLISSLNNIDIFVCGSDYTICKTKSKEFFAWGVNVSGEFGNKTNESVIYPIKITTYPSNIIDIKAGDNHNLFLTSNGQVYSCGSNQDVYQSNTYGQLGLDDNIMKKCNIPLLIEDIPKIKRIACGKHHSILIDINDNLWVFGRNNRGQLGLGDKQHRYKPILNKSFSNNVIDVSHGGNHTFIKTNTNEIYAFGDNTSSVLGFITNNYQEIPIQVFKDNESIWTSRIQKSRQKSARK